MGIAIGNKVELVKLEQVIKNEKNRKVYISKICDFVSDNTLQIAMPIYEGKIVPLPVDEKYSVCFYTDKGLLQCNAVITARYKSGNLFFLELLLLGELAKVQRREFYRYKCMVDAKIRIVSDEEYDKGYYADLEVPETKLTWNNAKILDLSGGGAKLVQTEHLDKNEVVKIVFSVRILDEVMNFGLYARILSSYGLKGKTNVFEQRIEFMKIAQDDRDRIIRFIFESERMARAKESGLK